MKRTREFSVFAVAILVAGTMTRPVMADERAAEVPSVDNAQLALTLVAEPPHARDGWSLYGAEGDEGTTLTFLLTVTGYFEGWINGAIFTSGKGEDFGDGGEPTAMAGEDYYHARRSFSFSYPSNTEMYFEIPTIQDAVVEPDEWFLTLVTSTRLGGDLRVRGWILDDDSGTPSSLSIDDAAVTEGDSGTQTAVFAVTMSPAATSTVTVDYSTCGVGCDPAATATDGDDYAIATGTLTFLPGETTKQIPVTVYGDSIVESNEAFFVYLLDPVNATIADNPGIGTIIDDDTPGTAVPYSSIGLVDPTSGQWHLRDYHSGAVTSFYFGNPGDFPLMGDWDCDGTDTPGMYRQSDGFVYVRNSNSVGIADRQFFLGNPGDVPLAGDFNNDGCDTVSIYRPAEQQFYIANELASNNTGIVADFSFGFGNPGDKPVTGDWDNDGTTEIGLHRETTGFFYWRNTLDTGIASDEIFFGDPGDRFVAGDWGIVDGVDTPAVFRPAGNTFFFRHTLTQGNADSQFVFGESSWLPVAGVFGLG